MRLARRPRDPRSAPKSIPSSNGCLSRTGRPHPLSRAIPANEDSPSEGYEPMDENINENNNDEGFQGKNEEGI